MIDISNVMRKQTRVIATIVSQSLIPVIYSYSVSAAFVSPGLEFGDFSRSDELSCVSKSAALEVSP